jgi:two-component system chemotaxis sensor kinase CheA
VIGPYDSSRFYNKGIKVSKLNFDHSLFDTLLEPIFVLSRDGKVVYCNEAAALICEHSVRKIIRGMYFKDLLTFSEPLEWLSQLVNVTSAIPYKEMVFTSHSGQSGKIQLTAQPLHSTEDTPQWIVFVRDVTLEERLQKKYRAELEQKEDVILALKKAQSELEEYSKNLEKMVQERTQEISRMNRLMKALLDSLSQGFFIFDERGQVLDVSSKACEHTLEITPDGRNIWDVLKLPEAKVQGFQRWMTTLFSEMLPFADLAPLGPDTYQHTQGLNISLEYFPLRNDDNRIDGVVVMATDITNLVEARRQAAVEKQHAEMIIHLVKNKDQVGRFLRESNVLLAELNSMLHAYPVNVDVVFRCLHTLKGGAGMLSVRSISEACHEAETELSNYKEHRGLEAANTLQAKCSQVKDSLEGFKEQAKEILGVNAMSSERQLEISTADFDHLLESVGQLPGGKSLANEWAAKLSQEPIVSFFRPYDETAEKIALKQDKKLRPMTFINGDLKVVPEVYGPLFASFVHAFRNAVDHGLESPEERAAQGKNEAGEIRVSFELLSQPERLKISVQDDGRGIDPTVIRTKMLAKLADQPAALRKLAGEDDHQILQHVFDSQFSTKESISELSGRGVGLDALKSEALALGGTAWVTSVRGQGSIVTVEVPWLLRKPHTLAA